jgi:hypothetical protein
MRNPRTPHKWHRHTSGVPADNHEVHISRGAWLCRACPFVGDFDGGTAHIISQQFEHEAARGRAV